MPASTSHEHEDQDQTGGATLTKVVNLLNALLIAQGQPPRELLTIDEAAAALGISRVTLYGMLQRGELDSVVIGERARRVPTSEVREFVARKLAEARGDPPPAHLPGTPIAPASTMSKSRATARQRGGEGRGRRATRRKTG